MLPGFSKRLFAHHHLRKEKGPIRVYRAFIPLMWPPCVQSPVPQRKNQNVGGPERSRRDQQSLRRRFVRGQGANQEAQRSDQSQGERHARRESEDGAQSRPAGVMSNNSGNE